MPSLEFKGKQHIYAHHLTVPYRPLVPDDDRSLDPAGADDNLIVHGDNLEALKALLPRYAERVKCVYIDPPYNTGNEGWSYNDNVNSPLMRDWLERNGAVDGEDLERHEKWLCMMWPRLQLLKELLTEDGIIFVSIDDNEQHHLRVMMDEIFGEENFVANFVWNSTKSITNPALVSTSHTHTIAYANQINVLKENRKNFKLPPLLNGFENPDDDPRGPWKADPFEAGGERPNQMYPITNPKTGETFYPRQGNCWKNDLTRFLELMDDGRIVFGKYGNGRPQRKRFLSEAEGRGTTPNTWWDDVGTTANGTDLLKTILGQRVFENPKPVGLLHRIMQLASEKDSIILDSFAGSGTTAQAVLALNKEDGGNRKFILVECEDYADSVTAERVRRVVRGVPDARDTALREGLGGSFTFCTLGPAIERDAMLSGAALPPWSTLAAYLLYTASGVSVGAGELEPLNDDGLFHRGAAIDYYLIYEPDLAYLRSEAAMFNGAWAQRIEAASGKEGRKAVVFGPGKYIGQYELTDMGIVFCQLPEEMYRGG